MKNCKRLLALILAIVTLCLLVVPASAYEQPTYYKGHTITYLGEWPYGTCTWNGGFLWLTKFKEEYYLKNNYYCCWNYYHDGWIANNGQTLSITTSKTTTASISNTVSAEIGAEYAGINGKLGASMTTSESVSYSTSLGLSYDLKNYSAKSVRIAAMGYVTKLQVDYYKKNKLQKTFYTYAYDTDWGYEITLVYRK